MLSQAAAWRQDTGTGEPTEVMATKSELESERQACHALAMRAITSERQDLYGEAINLALASFPYLDAAMQYERKFMKIDCPPLPTVEIIFRCAPPLFHRHALDAADSFLSERRRIDKEFARELKDRLANARELMRAAFRLWGEIQTGTSSPDRDAMDVAPIRNYWERTGLIVNRRTDGRNNWLFATRLDEPTHGKCSHCGHVVTAKKIAFLDKARCPKCTGQVPFVILGPPPRNNS